MNVGEFYTKIIAAGIKADPRPAARVKDVLAQEQKKYDALKKEDKKFYDKDNLINPYADTRVLYGALTTEITTIMVGVDIDAAEIVVADRLSEKGKKIDLVMAHHPEGHAFANFYDVMRMQADIFNSCGVSIVAAESLTEERLGEVRRGVASANHMKSVDTARLLDMPFMCAHTPADNHVVQFLTQLFKKKKPATVKDIMALLSEIPEYSAAKKRNSGPFVLAGAESARCGEILVDMTGGTSGSADIYEHLARSGVGTIVAMHMSEGHLKKAKEHKLNVINAGHMSSDALGINLLLDTVLAKTAIKVINISGFERVSRGK